MKWLASEQYCQSTETDLKKKHMGFPCDHGTEPQNRGAAPCFPPREQRAAAESEDGPRDDGDTASENWFRHIEGGPKGVCRERALPAVGGVPDLFPHRES